MRPTQERQSQERQYLIDWRCEECKGSFTTVITEKQVDEWSVVNLPEIPACLKCGKERVFYKGAEEVGRARVPREDLSGKRQAGRL